MIQLYNGDCLELMKNIPDGSVDLVLTDPPYGKTANKWDRVIPLELMWEQLNRIIKPNGAILIFGSEPFSSVLNFSNIKNFKYEWIWKKPNSTGFNMARKRPLKNFEKISVFYKKQPKYNPQGLKPYGKINRRSKSGDNWGEMKTNEYIQEFTNYPTQELCFKYDKKKVHPTQKPVALLEYLIKTYTDEGETVLDFTAGSGSTGVACVNTNRNFIGIELDKGYFDIAEKRINEAQNI